MNPQTGQIFTMSREEMEATNRRRDTEGKPRLIELSDNEHKTLKPQSPTKRKNYMRNKPCPCKSGQKFKACCWGKYS